MNLHVRFCRNSECGKGYDIGTEFDLCSKCRREKEVDNNEGQNFRRNDE